MKLSRRRVAAGLLLAGPALLGLAACNTRFGATLDRPADPVVLAGSALPKLVGTSPSSVVAFSWDGSSWHQVPVQVDERDLVSPGQIYHQAPANYPKLFNSATLFKILVYTPPAVLSAGYSSLATYTPPDSDPNLDANDEVSFLAADTGQQASGAAGTPAGVDASSREEVHATDPLVPTHSGYVYLFHSATLTGGGAGTTGVDYTFSLDSGSYTGTYKTGLGVAPNNSWGFNPEHSTVSTPSYTLKLSDRWLNDGLTVTAAGASGANLLDRAKYYVTNALCVRTENTFDGADTGEGAFIVSLTGPVRGIRSYIGANSYKYTVNTDLYYPSREDTVTELRGHSGLPGFAGADDYATGLTGLRYTDPANAGLPIDGVPDTFTPITSTTGSGTPPPSWQMVSGPAGTMVTVRTLDTDISGLVESTLYQDESPAATAPCTGDASAWGLDGVSVNSPVYSVPITDPTLSSTPASFVSHRYRYFAGPGFQASGAPTLDAQAKHPIQATVAG